MIFFFILTANIRAYPLIKFGQKFQPTLQLELPCIRDLRVVYFDSDDRCRAYRLELHNTGAKGALNL